MRFRDFERRAHEIFDSIPDEYRAGVEYVTVSDETVPHPEREDVYTLGECATGELDLGYEVPEPVRSGVHLYYGSFLALSELDPDFDWEAELHETLVHEIRHHREWLAGEADLEVFDYAAEENFKRREGEPFDPFFYRGGEVVEDDAWEVDGDLFVERRMDLREFERTPEVEVSIGGERIRVPRPDVLGDVHFLYLDRVRDDPGDTALVLVRRRGAWESLRALFHRVPPEVLQSEIDPIPE